MDEQQAIAALNATECTDDAVELILNAVAEAMHYGVTCREIIDEIHNLQMRARQ